MKLYTFLLINFSVIVCNAQQVDYYKFDFSGSSTSTFACIYVINSKSSSSYMKELKKQPAFYSKTVMDNYVIKLTQTEFDKLSIKTDSLLKLYSKEAKDSSFNVFLITKKFKNSKNLENEISKFNPDLKLFYISMYNYIRNNIYPEKLEKAFHYQITFLEEQVYGEKILKE